MYYNIKDRREGVTRATSRKKILHLIFFRNCLNKWKNSEKKFKVKEDIKKKENSIKQVSEEIKQINDKVEMRINSCFTNINRIN